MGMSRDTLKRIFEKFYRAQPERAQSGTGLGLAICKAIIEAHGGRLWAMPNPGGGTVFRFSLPAHQATREEGSDA